MDSRTVLLLAVFALTLGACKQKVDKTQQSTADSGNSPYSFYGDYGGAHHPAGYAALGSAPDQGSTVAR